MTERTGWLAGDGVRLFARWVGGGGASRVSREVPLGWQAHFAASQAAPAVREARAALVASGLRDRDLDAFWRRAFELAVAGYFREASRARDLTPFRISARVREAIWHGLRDVDLRPRLASIPCPTLIVHGAHDPTPLEAARELAGRLPAARLEVFEGSGHVPFVEERGRLMRLLGDFLPRLGVAAGPGPG